MKKVIFLLTLFVGIGLASFSQSLTTTLVSQYGTAVDTVDNTETVYLSLKTGVATGAYYKAGTVVFKATEISGTGGGTATLQISANGVDFANAPVDTAYTIVDQTATQTFAWRLTNVAVKAIRIKVTGSGTMSYKVYGSAFLSN